MYSQPLRTFHIAVTMHHYITDHTWETNLELGSLVSRERIEPSDEEDKTEKLPNSRDFVGIHFETRRMNKRNYID